MKKDKAIEKEQEDNIEAKVEEKVKEIIKEEKRQSALGVASMVLGIAILFGILTLIRRSVKKSFAISGIILSIIAIVIAFSITLFAITMTERSGRELERIARESKERKKYEVTNVELKVDETSTKVTGKIKNLSGEKKDLVVVSIPVVDKETGKTIIDLFSVSRNLNINGVWEFEAISNQTVKYGKVDEKNIRVFGM